MKKIVVNTSNCIGCGACVGIDPEHFDFNDDGLSHPISQENLDSPDLQNAFASCPVAIISLEEEHASETTEE
ncbi:MAG: ferredoxin [Bacilli bacterium]|nr:ferredoxin [Bacilli bacterium]